MKSNDGKSKLNISRHRTDKCNTATALIERAIWKEAIMMSQFMHRPTIYHGILEDSLPSSILQLCREILTCISINR